ncbi:DUF1801 domain-containing protein [Phenylobacterium sp. J426]|uniref:iron chaperone n=1 Tax=Phenylobacterium sp. J426 TaxID=2898439 RepID=UPI002151CF16|nr:DUF1801 domain-containing protein [Phenylobacterium sp. J426]MCR5876359.1 DUF1801 domain-containing protein [Phenylobacterium sp. J426]
MVQSPAATVDAYLTEVSAMRVRDLVRLREIARRVLTGHQEQMLWGRPTYLREGRAVFGFAEQKQYVSLYFGEHALLDGHGEAVADVRRSKGCLRYRKSAPIDWGLIERLLAEAAA